MIAQPLDKEFDEYWSRLTILEKQSLLIVAKTYVLTREDIETVNIAQYNREIDEAISRVENGEFFTHEEVMKISKEW